MNEWVQASGWLLAGAGIICLLVAIAWRWHSRRRRTGARLNGVQLEVHAANPIADLVIETQWRVSLSMTNRSRGPRNVPVLASRATVVAGRKTYLAEVFIECGVDELSPDQVALAWAEFVIPSGVTPRTVTLTKLSGKRGSLRLRLGKPLGGLNRILTESEFRGG